MVSALNAKLSDRNENQVKAGKKWWIMSVSSVVIDTMQMRLISTPSKKQQQDSVGSD